MLRIIEIENLEWLVLNKICLKINFKENAKNMDVGFWVKCLMYILAIKVSYVQSFNRQLFGDGAFEGEINNKVCNLLSTFMYWECYF